MLIARTIRRFCQLAQFKIEEFAKFDLRIGTILSCVPELDSLYVSQVDLGQAQPRTIVSGLRKHVPIQAMTGQVIIAANLKPAKLGGILSQGMVICASVEDKLQILRPRQTVSIGCRLVLESVSVSENASMQNKKKWTRLLQQLTTDSAGDLSLKDIKLKAQGIPIGSNLISAKIH